MRVYLPATTVILQAILESGELERVPLTGFAVTAGLREWYAEDDLEELEYAAMREAARSSLRLIDADPSAARWRVVLAADVDDAEVQIRDDLDRGVIRLGGPPSLGQLASVHVDDKQAESTVAAAAAAILRADLGDDAAQDVVDDADGFELSWYATQELAALLEDA